MTNFERTQEIIAINNTLKIVKLTNSEFTSYDLDYIGEDSKKWRLRFRKLK